MIDRGRQRYTKRSSAEDWYGGKIHGAPPICGCRQKAVQTTRLTRDEQKVEYDEATKEPKDSDSRVTLMARLRKLGR